MLYNFTMVKTCHTFTKTPRVTTEVNYRLRVIMMHQRRFIDCNKCITRMLIVGQPVHGQGQGTYGNSRFSLLHWFSFLQCQFCLLLKATSYLYFFFSFLKKSKPLSVSFPFYLATLAHPYVLLPKVPSPFNFILGTKICCLKFIVTINESFSKWF